MEASDGAASAASTASAVPVDKPAANGDMGRPRRGLGLVPERLQKREQERLLEVERRKQERQNQTVEEENSDFFAAAFAREREAVERLLGCADQEAPGPGADPAQLDEAASRLQALQKLLNDAVLYLAPYDLRLGQEALARLQGALAERRQELQPKKRFAFKSRRKDPAASAPSPAASAPPPEKPPQLQQPPPQPTPPLLGGVLVPSVSGFSNRESETLQMQAKELHQRDILLTGLTDCTIRLYGNPNTLRLTKARGCTVLCGPVSTSVFLEDCVGCVLAVACQQLRTHTTRDTRIFLQVTSRAIVEDCSGVQFAPYTWSYPGIDQDFEGSGLDRNKNNWRDVDDFNWLARGVASPNWSILPEEERIIQWD
ncbi:tubulin-specific chaperone C [Gracilinanus agilis]|uniref:tubulin-specific chaperone C n=1 Tax=Gracilinanus agilis TaxID=191870 RepID=UPI001CFD5CAF|nr:tubulin-specific chaperone C [Gracilinanus agilis]